MTNIIAFDDFDESIRVTEDERYSVYDVIRFCGKKGGGERKCWERLIERYSEVVSKTHNFKFPGRGQRNTPVADRENILYILGLLPGAIGRAYREQAARTFVQYLDASPELAESIIDRATPDDLKRIQARLKKKQIRVSFTNTLQEHGVTESWQFASCTNEIYKPILGGTAKQIKAARNLPAKSNLVEGMSMVEWAAVGLAEALADEKIEQENRQGFVPCCDACTESGERVGRVFEV